MPTLTSLPETASWTKASRVIVDWSEDAHQDTSLRMKHLTEWVRSYPKRAAVHVVLRRSLHQAHDRRLQSRLQSLGCTVTMRSLQPMMA
jgi:hypothetical protein